MDNNKNLDTYAVIGLTFGIISNVFLGTFIFSILGIIFSSLGKASPNKNGKAVAGLVLSITSICISFITLVVLILLYSLKMFILCK